MWDPSSGWFYYQKRRRYRTRIRELRWCQGWMSWALASYLENCGGDRIDEGIPGPRAVARPEPQPVRAAVRTRARRAGQRAAHPAAARAARHRRLLPGDPGRRLRLRACSASSSPSGTRRRKVTRRRAGARPGRPGQRDRQAGRAWPTASFQEGDVTKLDFDDRVRPGRERRQPRARRGRHRGHARRCCTRCAPAGGWSSTCPATSGGGSCSAAGSTSTSPATSGPATGPRSWSASCRRPGSR